MSWWNSISGLNQLYYCGALFFSVFFLWQLIAAFAGTDGGGESAHSGFGGDAGADGSPEGADAGADPTYAHFEEGAESDAVHSMDVFRIVSLRSLITFFTLFFWGNALYTHNGLSFVRSFAYSTLWGLAGMLSVAVVFYLLTRLSEDGTASLANCVGKEGTVYQDIPEQGVGRVRTTVGQAVSHVKARSVSGARIAAGTRVGIVRQAESNLVEVKPLGPTGEKRKENEA